MKLCCIPLVVRVHPPLGRWHSIPKLDIAPIDRRSERRRVIAFQLYAEAGTVLGPMPALQWSAGPAAQQFLQQLPPLRQERYLIGQDVAHAVASIQELATDWNMHPSRVAAQEVFDAMHGDEKMNLSLTASVIARLATETHAHHGQLMSVLPTVSTALTSILNGLRRVPDVPVNADALQSFSDLVASLHDLYKSVRNSQELTRCDLAAMAVELRYLRHELESGVAFALTVDAVVAKQLDGIRSKFEEEVEDMIKVKSEKLGNNLNDFYFEMQEEYKRFRESAEKRQRDVSDNDVKRSAEFNQSMSELTAELARLTTAVNSSTPSPLVPQPRPLPGTAPATHGVNTPLLTAGALDS